MKFTKNFRSPCRDLQVWYFQTSDQDCIFKNCQGFGNWREAFSFGSKICDIG
jgi:hypothetical protein